MVYLLFLSTLPARGATYTAFFILREEAGFLSTLPARGATTEGLFEAQKELVISIHAPREGSDAKTGQKCE